jgi:metallo-beta-lactamase class B
MIGIKHWAGRYAAACLVVLVCAWMNAPSAEAAARKSKLCPQCEQWNQPHKPFRIWGNTWFVGTDGLSAILITSDYGHVLIDGGLPESAPQIAANIEALGFHLKDVKAILNSHTHYDHAGGIAELQRLSGAQVYALRPADEVLRTGKLTREDPQFGHPAPAIPPVSHVWPVQDDQQLGVGHVRVRALATPGHTPGGTSWSWESCEESKCLTLVYADSLTPVSADKYRFRDHPEVQQQFERSFARLEAARCEVLITPHPSASRLFERLDRAARKAEDIRDEAACKGYVATAREALVKRLQEER